MNAYNSTTNKLGMVAFDSGISIYDLVDSSFMRNSQRSQKGLALQERYESYSIPTIPVLLQLDTNQALGAYQLYHAPNREC